MKRGGSVQNNRMFPNDFVQDIPDFRPFFFHKSLGALDGCRGATLFQLMEDEGLEEFERHLLGQPTLIELQLWPNDNDRSAGIVNTLS